MALLIEGASAFFEHFEPNDKAPVRGTPAVFVASGITSTSVTSAALSGAAATNYVGCQLRALNGTQKGQRRIIKAFNPGTDTATVDAWNGSADATVFELWVLPTPWVVAASAGASGSPGPPTVVAVTSADTSGRPGRGASENWSGTGQPSRYALFCISGTNANRWALIEGWSGGTFTLQAFGAWAADSAGDLYVPLKMIHPHGGEYPIGDFNQVYVERPTVRGHFEERGGVLAGRTSSISFGTEVQGPTGLASGATLATRPTESGDMLDSIFAENRDGGTAVGSGSTTTSIKVTTATGTQADGRFRIGSVVLINGEATVIRAMTDGAGGEDTWTVSPALSSAPASGAAVVGGVCYTPIYPETGHRTHGFWRLDGGTTWRNMYGALPNLKVEGFTEGEILRWMWEYTGDGHYTMGGYNFGSFLYANERFPIGTRRIPRPGRNSIIKIDGTITHVKSFSLDYGFQLQPQTTVTGQDQGAGQYVGKRATAGTMTVWMEDASWIAKFERETNIEILVQSGNVSGDCFVWYVPAARLTTMPQSKDGMGLQHEMAFRVLESGVTGNDGSGTIRSLADITAAVL